MRPAWLLAAALAACGPGDSRTMDGQERPLQQRAEADRCQRPGDYENCVDFLPAERMRGVWISGFERSSFVTGDGTMPDPRRSNLSGTWLTFASGARPDPALRAEMDALRGVAVVSVEFVGRRSRAPGGFGHMGGAEHLVIVDRMISARLLGTLPTR